VTDDNWPPSHIRVAGYLTVTIVIAVIVAIIPMSIIGGFGAISSEDRTIIVKDSLAIMDSMHPIPTGFFLYTISGERYFLPTSIDGHFWIAFPRSSSWNSLDDTGFADGTSVLKYDQPYKITIWHSIFGGYVSGPTGSPRISHMEALP
jgi:hypothetical protein